MENFTGARHGTSILSLFKKEKFSGMLKQLNSRSILIIAVALIILSGISFGLILAVPFFPISLTKKGIYVTALIITGEITWWTGIAVAGKQVIARYGKYFNPLTWPVFMKKRSGQNPLDEADTENP